MDKGISRFTLGVTLDLEALQYKTTLTKNGTEKDHWVHGCGLRVRAPPSTPHSIHSPQSMAPLTSPSCCVSACVRLANKIAEQEGRTFTLYQIQEAKMFMDTVIFGINWPHLCPKLFRRSFPSCCWSWWSRWGHLSSRASVTTLAADVPPPVTVLFTPEYHTARG